MKIIYIIPYIFLLLLLIFILNLQCVFPNFALCFGDDGHADIDIAFTGNQFVTIHHIKEHHHSLPCSDNNFFLSNVNKDHCYDMLISLSSNFFGFNAKKAIDYYTIINPFFISLSMSFDIVVNYEEKYFNQTSDPPKILTLLPTNIPLII